MYSHSGGDNALSAITQGKSTTNNMDRIQTVTSRVAYEHTAADAGPAARVPIEVRISVDDPFEAFRAVEEAHNAVLLETSGGHEGWSYIGLDPERHIQVRAPMEAHLGDGSPTLAELQAALDAETLVRGECSVPYPCGIIGWLSYEISRELEPQIPARASETLPRAQFAIFPTMIAWQEPSTAPTLLHITGCPRVGDDPAGTYQSTVSTLTEIGQTIQAEAHPGNHVDTAAQIAFESMTGPVRFATKVRAIKAAIRAGDTFQTNLSHRLDAPAQLDPLSVYAALREVNPAPYSGLLRFPGMTLISASPELLLSVEGDRLVTEPIAGTRPRGDDAAADARFEAELTGDEKERAEHAMLVDLERNDLGKVCEYGSVEVTEYRRVDRYAEVMHLVSVVEGRRREGVGLTDAIAAMFPGGTITGAPKPKTMELIATHEDRPRGPYTGSMGIFGFDDRATLNIIIRTIEVHGGRFGLQVGAGIVHDSDPEREYSETMDKARGLVRAVDAALAPTQQVKIAEAQARSQEVSERS
jgi:aminodeoxychorismate synthase, subunit I (EC 6.3.5.8)